MKKNKKKKQVSEIKSYTQEEAKEKIKQFESDFANSKTTSISIWEYEGLKNILQMDNYQMDLISDNKEIIKNCLIRFGINKNGSLYPYISYAGEKYKIKGGINYLKENNFGNISRFKLVKNNIEIISSNSPLIITCPECNSCNIEMIDNKTYCANPNCSFWFKAFYADMLSMISDKRLKKWIKQNVNYNDFNVLNKIYSDDEIAEYCKKNFTDNQRKHLQVYLETIGKKYVGTK